MKLAKKLSSVYSAASVKKRGKNPYFGYEYVMAEDVFETVRRKLAELGVFVFHSIDSVERRELKTRQGSATVTSVAVTITLADGDSDETVSLKWVGEALDNEDKGVQKAATSAVKYALMKLFLVSSGEDDPDSGPAPQNAAPAPKSDPARNQDACRLEGGKVLRRVMPDKKDQEILREILGEKGIPMSTFAEMVGEQHLSGYDMTKKDVFDLADSIGDYSKDEEDPFA